MLLRHALGVLGVAAAGVLLAVSAVMNYKMGESLGRTPFDGQIYGAASAAADCFKALIPFFFFAAIRNKMWSQAAASAVVWVVVTAYSLTSAVGHAALNRNDSTGTRAVGAASYTDLRADLKRAEEQLSWIPQHRPAATVQSELDGAKTQRAWSFTKSCTDITGKTGRDFCQQVHALSAEHASAVEAAGLEIRVSDIKKKLAGVRDQGVIGDADPQATLFSRLTGFDIPTVQTALALFIALLLEIGSGFGMYVAFSQWRLYDRAAPEAPAIQPAPQPLVVPTPVAVAPVAVPVTQKARAIVANDNKTPAKLVPPVSDVERFNKERIEAAEGSTVTATELYEDYCTWCEQLNKEPLALPTFGREFSELGIVKQRIGGRIRYLGIRVSKANEGEEDKKPPVPIVNAA